MSIFAKSPDGSVWHLYASSETPDLTSVKHPAPSLIIDTAYESPCFYSTNRTIARQWIVDDAGTFTLKVVPIPAGTVEYVEFLTPAGVHWVCGLNEDGTLYTELFTSNVPKKRRLVTTLMHKGQMMWVADSRMPPPTRRP